MDNILREPTKQELDDFQVLDGNFHNEDIEKRENFCTQIRKSNRQVLKNIKDKQEMSGLICEGCFVSEFDKNLVNANMKDCNEYKRLKLREVAYSKKKLASGWEKAFVLRFEKCQFCGKQVSICLDETELSPEAIKFYQSMIKYED